jgi:hypothetical protein
VRRLGVFLRIFALFFFVSGGRLQSKHQWRLFMPKFNQLLILLHMVLFNIFEFISQSLVL